MFLKNVMTLSERLVLGISHIIIRESTHWQFVFEVQLVVLLEIPAQIAEGLSRID